jgi:hypothetical protein
MTDAMGLSCRYTFKRSCSCGRTDREKTEKDGDALSSAAVLYMNGLSGIDSVMNIQK